MKTIEFYSVISETEEDTTLGVALTTNEWEDPPLQRGNTISHISLPTLILTGGGFADYQASNIGDICSFKLKNIIDQHKAVSDILEWHEIEIDSAELGRRVYYFLHFPKMKLLADFPSIGEPHYAQAIPAEKIVKNSLKIFKLEENKHPFVTMGEKKTNVVRDGNKVHIYMTAMRSHFSPDNIEGIKLGDDVFFHVTNLEQDWDVPHGFAVKGALNAELLIMPGETQTLKWTPLKVGMYPFYCTDFCSALHQEMSGYARVSAKGSNVPLSFSLGKNSEDPKTILKK